MELFQIHNEDGGVGDGTFIVTKSDTGRKNVIQIQNVETGDKRLIHKDRVFLLEEKRRNKVEKDQESKVKSTKKAKKKKKKPLEKFDLKQLESSGILYQKKDSDSGMEVAGQKFKVKSYWLVSEDATKMTHFNLYNGSLGRKNRVPEFDDKDNVRHEFYGNLEALEKDLEKKGYIKV